MDTMSQVTVYFEKMYKHKKISWKISKPKLNCRQTAENCRTENYPVLKLTSLRSLPTPLIQRNHCPTPTVMSAILPLNSQRVIPFSSEIVVQKSERVEAIKRRDRTA